MKVQLKARKRSGRSDLPWSQFDWVKAEPFYVNPRGILVHRVRRVTTYIRSGKEQHHAVEYWCGNSSCFSLDEEDRLVGDPPAERLLCAFCESRAERAEEKSADKLAKRHVHRGVLKAHRVCCRESDNN